MEVFNRDSGSGLRSRQLSRASICQPLVKGFPLHPAAFPDEAADGSLRAAPVL